MIPTRCDFLDLRLTSLQIPGVGVRVSSRPTENRSTKKGAVMRKSVFAIVTLLLWATATTVRSEPAPGIIAEPAPTPPQPPPSKIMPHQWTVDGQPLPQPPASTAGQIAKIEVKRTIEAGPDRGTAMSRASAGHLGPDGKTIAQFEVHTYDAEGHEIHLNFADANRLLDDSIVSEPVPPGSGQAVLTPNNAGLFQIAPNGTVTLQFVTASGVTGDATLKVWLKDNAAISGTAKATVSVMMGPSPKPQPTRHARSGSTRHLSSQGSRSSTQQLSSQGNQAGQGKNFIQQHPYITGAGAAAVVVGAVAIGGGGGGGGGGGKSSSQGSSYKLYSGSQFITVTCCYEGHCASQSVAAPIALCVGPNGILTAMPGLSQNGSSFSFGNANVTWSGTISGNTITGTINGSSPGCTAIGTFNMTKSSEATAMPNITMPTLPGM